MSLAAAAPVAAAGAPAPTAGSFDVVRIPEHPDRTAGLTLLGASDQGVAVEQDAAGDATDGAPRVFSGPEGGVLTRRLGVEQQNFDYSPPPALGVVGPDLVWQRYRPGAGIHFSEAHRTDLRTGKDVLDGLMPAPEAYTGTSWLTDQIADTVILPFPPPVLRSYGPGGTRYGDDVYLTATDVMSGLGNTGRLAADTHSALQASVEYTDPQAGDGAPRASLHLVDLNRRTKETVVASIPDAITAVALSPSTIAWTTRLGAGPLVVHLRARGGGPVTSYSDPTATSVADADGEYGDGDQLAAGDGRVGYLAGPDGDQVLRVVALGGAVGSVAVPAGSAGIAVVGDRFLTAAGGPPATAGVYSYDGTALTRTATVPAAGYPVRSLALTGSRLYYTDTSASWIHPDPDDGSNTVSVWTRPVTGDRQPALGPRAALVAPPAAAARVAVDSAISFSAGRGAVQAVGGGWRILDRGVQTGSFKGDNNDVKVSGPDILSDGTVHDATGATLYTVPVPKGSYLAEADIFGSTLAYALESDDDERATVVSVSDLRKPVRHTVARITMTPSCLEGPQVAVWGPLLAWDGCNNHGIHVLDRSTGRRRTVTGPDRPAAHAGVDTLTLGEGTLAWSTGTATEAVDLTARTLTPVRVAGSAEALVLDGHRIARQTRVGVSAAWDLRPLPFAPAYPARLIGSSVAAGFTPHGDGPADTWSPQFDVSKPLSAVRLVISDPATGRTVRTLTGTAPDGSVRDLTWDGRGQDGAAAGPGSYRWTLTGQPADGEGRLVAPDGRPRIAGTIELRAIGGGTDASDQR